MRPPFLVQLVLIKLAPPPLSTRRVDTDGDPTRFRGNLGGFPIKAWVLGASNSAGLGARHCSTNSRDALDTSTRTGDEDEDIQKELMYFSRAEKLDPAPNRFEMTSALSSVLSRVRRRRVAPAPGGGDPLSSRHAEGTLTDPAAESVRKTLVRRNKLVERAIDFAPHLRTLLFVAGILYALALPLPQLGRGHYISENALQPAQVTSSHLSLSLSLLDRATDPSLSNVRCVVGQHVLELG